MKFSKLAIVPFLLGLGSALTISDKSTNSSSALLHGLMYEDINRCGDGGLYGELLNNRAFQGENRTLDSYNGVDGAKLALVDEPLSDALPKSMKVSGSGFYNEGFFGISVKKGKKYTARFYAKGGSNFKVALKGVSSGDELVSAKAEKVSKSSRLFPSESNDFQLYTAELVPKEDAPDVDNGLYITFDGDEATFNFVSLMPEHFKGRENGLRVDIAETLNDLSGKFLRFPGGNNLEGQTVERRWKWNETIGALIDRPGREGDWTYPNTDGIGLHEYFEWCEDMDLTPILGVYAGYSLGGEEVAEDDLQPYIDEVLNELEYCLGDDSTEYGKKRIANGRKEPFDVKYVEIGNEDFFSKHYDYRFPAYKKAINEKYPDLTIIATTEIGIEFPEDEVVWWDQHNYQSPEWMIDSFDMYDNYPRNNTKVFQGEYAQTHLGAEFGEEVLDAPNMLSSASEAVFMLGMERNSDQVLAMCYAPTLQNVDATQWTPDMIQFNTESIAKSPSYYAHKLLFSTAGDKILELQDASFDPLYYVANLDTKNNRVHVKIANPTDKDAEFSAKVDVKGFENAKATAQSISSTNSNATNILGQEEQATLQPQDVSYKNGELKLDVGPYYVGVVTLQK
ncbi:hypothetical protein TRICI_003208 [Trichomonascus ciferrii]|uniref:non-reducing end alpha-L-arabinofuranosidase n=1 Tax=Trichomonascus ciferrii TaxID=44093 RepID=A0A642V4H9_9ASCO|nr:hypothetical protein TRICI_003208 [Trichomonascus ciferrii]